VVPVSDPVPESDDHAGSDSTRSQGSIAATGHTGRSGNGHRPKLKVMLIASAGGHLIQMYRLKPWWQQHDRVWVTFRKSDSLSMLAGESAEWAYHPTTRNLPNALRNLRLAWTSLRRHRPDVILSCGAGVAVPFFVVAKLLGIRTVYIEVYDRIDSPTLTGRMCHPISDLFLLQWEGQRRFYPKGRVIGGLL
jgi:UDP-N-acetylglucosamine:LPS N-acetylglucosamine transferase